MPGLRVWWEKEEKRLKAEANRRRGRERALAEKAKEKLTEAELNALFAVHGLSGLHSMFSFMTEDGVRVRDTGQVDVQE